MRRSICAAFVCVVVLLVATSAFAQTGSTQVSGFVQDSSKALVPGVTVTLTGNGSGSTTTDASGNYAFSVSSGGTYSVTPTKATRTPGSAGITTVDVIAIQRHFLSIGPPLTLCRLTAADVNADNMVNTVDVIATQRFFLGLSTGIANVGKYQFNPVNRSYVQVITNQTGQNYDGLIFGDVASPFVQP